MKNWRFEDGVLFLDNRGWEKSDFAQTFSYPGGEMQVRLDFKMSDNVSKILISASLTSTTDILQLALLKSALDGVVNPLQTRIELILPYLPYARADRRFMHGDCHGLETFGRLMLAMGFDDIHTLDVHSEEPAEKAFNGYQPTIFRPYSPKTFVTLAINTVDCEGPTTLLLPDAGAYKRYAPMIENSGLPVCVAGKKRDPGNGKLLEFTVPEPAELRSNVLLIDDIIDGGGTFIGIAEALRKKGYTGNLYLYGTHGIFSNGLSVLGQKFRRIFTTNSWREFPAYQEITQWNAYGWLEQNASH